MHVSQCFSDSLKTIVPMLTTRDLTLLDQWDDLVEESGKHMRGLSSREEKAFHGKSAPEDFFEMLKTRS